MTWTEVHRRTDIMHTVLARAEVDPHAEDLFAFPPGELDRLFGGVSGLLAALKYRWNNHLSVKLELGEAIGRTPVESYLELAAEQPALRALLDVHNDDLNTASRTPVHVY
ncbi:hypothetical protein [Nocardia camponoti]|uniref:Uncharacterized protein n=1 Tax=Nocardia camponoti TaxID=1616106 RepID=A0A917V5R1_9NOCA|nr:hypothetical protein [Nocardia camponoti]GGK43818.1 hypothetical protein GCM10011591_14280 [Nocardia camponoti]